MDTALNTKLYNEIHQIPVVAAQAAVAKLPKLPAANHLYTLARGSSDHAAQVINRLVSRTLGIPASALAPSQCQGLRFEHSLVIAISQSGASPDLSGALQAARDGGATTLGVINQPDSALQTHCDLLVPMGAGPEQSVAATKSFFQSVLLGYRLLNPQAPIPSVPAPTLNPALVRFLVEQPVITVLGRGETLGLAREVALKIQELLGKPAFAYSSAEVVHGPKAMVMERSAILVMAAASYQLPLLASADEWRSWGCSVHVCKAGAQPLDALYAMPAIYLALEAACRELGRPVDAPVGLNKVTMTD